MSCFNPKKIWSSLARKLVHRGDLAAVGKLVEAKALRPVKSEIKSLRQLMGGLKRDVERLKACSGASEQPLAETTCAGESELFVEALEMRTRGQCAAAIGHLEKHSGLAKNLYEVRALQCALALDCANIDEARKFLSAAVGSIEPERACLYWGPDPIISNSYWSKALRGSGRESKTFMWLHYAANRKEDFDLYVVDAMPSWLQVEKFDDLGRHGVLTNVLAFLHLIRHASVVHLPCSGSFLGQTALWDQEAAMFRNAGVKTVVLPYGGDYYCYSRVQDPSVRNGLLANYPQLARMESKTQRRLTYWQEEADCVLCGFMVDAMGRWDVTTFNFFHIDTDLWKTREEYSQADGRNGAVSIVHTPNHRGFKGTEFLVKAVEDLRREEGLLIDLRLLEGVPNAEVRRVVGESDILAEQFIATAYAMSGMEGMAGGLPVMANLHDEYYTRIYRRYSFLNECPILSTTPETLKENLRLLVTRPALRAALGRAGRQYVEKYHSFEAARFLFGKIHDRLLAGSDEPLINLFHPLLSAHAREHPRVQHPLVENRLPADSPFRQP